MPLQIPPQLLAQALMGQQNPMRQNVQSFDEEGFQSGIRATDWFRQFVDQYGEEPDLRPMSENPEAGPNYDYRKAWAAGIRPAPNANDAGRYHWPSSLDGGEMLKSKSHPTAWKEHFMRQYGVDPDTLPPEEIERLRGGGLPQSDMDAATRRELYPSEDTYFKENPNVGGMVSEDDKVLLNPYSMLSAEEMKAVQLNEYSRLMMKQKDYRPGFDLTPGQASTLDATTYQNAPEQARRETIAARLLSGDPSGGTPTGDQLSFTKGLRDMLQEGQVTPEMEQFMQGEVEKHLISQAPMGMPNDSVGQEQTLRPLNAGEFRQNPDGSKSSELSMTVQMGDKWTNIPSLWMTPDGVQELDQGAAMEAAQQYMEQTGKAFPTFETVDDAVGAAQKRSLAGAVSHGALAR